MVSEERKQLLRTKLQCGKYYARLEDETIEEMDEYDFFHEEGWEFIEKRGPRIVGAATVVYMFKKVRARF